jgi:hypothetical protein
MEPRSRVTPTRMLPLHVVSLFSKVEGKNRRPTVNGETQKPHPSHVKEQTQIYFFESISRWNWQGVDT